MCLNQIDRMCDKKNRFPRLLHLLEPTKAFALESDITNGESLINNKNFWFRIYRGGKGQADIHPAGISTDGMLNEFSNPRKINDFIKTLIYFFSRNPKKCCIEVNIFPAGKRGIKSST